MIPRNDLVHLPRVVSTPRPPIPRSNLACGFLLLLAFASPGLAQCGTLIAGPVGGTWTLDGSPYCVVGDVQISGLNIEPGVRVEVDGNYEIRVLTGLRAQGTDSQPILFTSKNPKLRWKGLLFERSPSTSSLIHCRVEQARQGAIRLFGGTIDIRNSIFHNNVSQGEGGAIRATPGGKADFVIRNCVFSENIAKASGGAISVTMEEGTFTLENSVITNNLSNPSLAFPNPPRMLFDTQGGGLKIDGNAVLRNCIVEENTCISRNSSGIALASGGGIYTTNGELRLENCILRNNDARSTIVGDSGTAVSHGGGFYQNNGTSILTNTIVACNTATPQGIALEVSEGGGIYINSGDTFLENCTVTDNDREGLRRAGGVVSVTNSILFGNRGTALVGTVDATYSCIETPSDPLPGVGNINRAPSFAGTGCECTDFALASGSAGIDAGNPGAAFTDSCFPPATGESRNDMGAFGGPGACNWDASCNGPNVPRVLLVQVAMIDADLSPGEMLEVHPSVDNGRDDYVVDAYLWITSPSGLVTSFVRNSRIPVPPLYSFTRTYEIGPAGSGILSETGTYTFGIRLVDADTGLNLTSEVRTFRIGD